MSLTDTLAVRELKCYFRQRGAGRIGTQRTVRAVDGVSFSIPPATTLGLVGESGCGKSTLARAVLRLHKPESGSVYLAGTDITSLSERELRRGPRRRMQMIFQDPDHSLNPRKRVGEILSQPLKVHATVAPQKRRRHCEALLEQVGLDASMLDRFPHEFSGGQKQRIGIARALALEPQLIVADEPVSALDVSVQAQILRLMRDLKARLKLSYLFISHDLGVVRYIADTVAVMYLGRIVEMAPRDNLFAVPKHPYTVALLSAIPEPVARAENRGIRSRIMLPGEMPNPANPPGGCPFHTRCPIARDRCRVEAPPLVTDEAGHSVACHFPGELTATGRSRPTA
ncbi:MAG: ABC transporter ATP-binding protein, partial [Spirochaetota bacterium]